MVMVLVAVRMVSLVSAQPIVQSQLPNRCSTTERVDVFYLDNQDPRTLIRGSCNSMPSTMNSLLQQARSQDSSWTITSTHLSDYNVYWRMRLHPTRSSHYPYSLCFPTRTANCRTSWSNMGWTLMGTRQYTGKTYYYDCLRNFTPFQINWCLSDLDVKMTYCGACSSGWAMTSSCTIEKNRVCQKCVPGTYVNGNQCRNCPIGTVSFNSANTQCVDCSAEAGLYQDMVGQSNCKTCSNPVCQVTELFVPCSNTANAYCLQCPNTVDPVLSFKPYPVGMDSPSALRRSPPSTSRRSCETECEAQVNCAGYVLSTYGNCVALLDWPFDRGLRMDGNRNGLFYNRSTGMDQQVIFRKSINDDDHVGVWNCQLNPCVESNTVLNSCVAFGVCVCKPGFLGNQCQYVADSVTASSGQNCEVLVQDIASSNCPCGLDEHPTDSSVCIQVTNSTVSKRFMRTEDILECLDFYQKTLVLDPFANIDDVPFRSLGHGTDCLDESNAEMFEVDEPGECSSIATDLLRSAFEWSFDTSTCLIANEGVLNTFPTYSSSVDSTCFVSGFKVANPGSRSAVVTHPSVRVLTLESAQCMDPESNSGMFFDVINESGLSSDRIALDSAVGEALVHTGEAEDSARSYAFLMRADLMSMIGTAASFCGIPCKCGSFAVHSSDIACSGRIETITEAFEHARAELRCVEESQWGASIENLSFLVNTLNCLAEYAGDDETGEISGNVLLEASHIVSFAQNNASEEALNLIPIEILWKAHLVDLRRQLSSRAIVIPADPYMQEPRVVVSRLGTFAETLQVIEEIIPRNEVQYKFILQIAALSSVRIIEAIDRLRTPERASAHLLVVRETLNSMERALGGLQAATDALAGPLDVFIVNFVNVRNPDVEKERMRLMLEFVRNALDMTHAVSGAVSNLALSAMNGEASISGSSFVSFKSGRFENALLALEQLLGSSPQKGEAIGSVSTFLQVRADLMAIDSNVALQSSIADLGENYVTMRNLVEDLAFTCLSTAVQLLVAAAQLEPGRTNVLPWLKQKHSRLATWRRVPALALSVLVEDLEVCPRPELPVISTQDEDLDEDDESENETTSSRLLLERRQGFGVNLDLTEMRRVLQLKSEGHEELQTPCTSFNTRLQDAAVRANEILEGLRIATRSAQDVFIVALDSASREAEDDWVRRFETIDETFRTNLGLSLQDEPTAALDEKLSQFVEAIVRERSILIEKSLREFVNNLCEAERYKKPGEMPFGTGTCQFTSRSIYGRLFETSREDPTEVHSFHISFDQDQSLGVCPLRLCEVTLFRKSGAVVPLEAATQEHQKVSAFLAADGDPNTCTGIAKTFSAEFRVEDIHQIDRVEIRRELNDWVDEVKIEIDGEKLGTSNCGSGLVCPPVFLDFGESSAYIPELPLSTKLLSILELLERKHPRELQAIADPLEKQASVKCSLNRVDSGSSEFWVNVNFGSFERNECLENEQILSMNAILYDSAGQIVPRPGTGSVFLEISSPNPGTFYKYMQTSSGTWEESSFDVMDSGYVFSFSYVTITGGESCEEGTLQFVPADGPEDAIVCFSGLQSMAAFDESMLASPYATWNLNLISVPVESEIFRADLHFELAGNEAIAGCNASMEFSLDGLSAMADPMVTAFSSKCETSPLILTSSGKSGLGKSGRALLVTFSIVCAVVVAAFVLHRRRQQILQHEWNRNSKVVMKEDVESEEVNLADDL